MKPTLLLLTTLTATTLAQGPLLPLAAPAPSMKSLDQIEPRTAISAGNNITINLPGSYYLTGNITGPISILASDVTLDLNGFVITSSGVGIGIAGSPSYRNITIRNGSIVGSGTMTFTGSVAGTFSGNTGTGIVAYGRSAGSVSGQNIRIEDINIRGFQKGIFLSTGEESDGGRHVISNCTIRDFGLNGISVTQCVLRDTLVHHGAGSGVTGNAIVAQNLIVDRVVGSGVIGSNLNLEHTTVRSCSGNGIQATYSQISGGQITACADGISGSDNQIDRISVNSCTGSGIFSPNSSVTHATAAQNANAGIWADSSTIAHCIVRFSGADGIRGVNSIVSNCKSSGNDTTTDGYLAAGIVWGGGRQIDNVCDLYAPASPAP